MTSIPLANLRCPIANYGNITFTNGRGARERRVVLRDSALEVDIATTRQAENKRTRGAFSFLIPRNSTFGPAHLLNEHASHVNDLRPASESLQV